MKQKTFLQVVGVIFSAGAVIHALRLVLGWEAVLAGWAVPWWISLVGVFLAAYLAYNAFKLMK